mmetsp:Transcript_26788/g.34786  ORF Transcript_26788/g.34786 Transcript_26788/m.34786 type:complete len:385 (-) Transcript_26788:246-1400(-)
MSMDSTLHIERSIWNLVQERQDLLKRMEEKELGLELMRLLISALPDPCDNGTSYKSTTVEAKRKRQTMMIKVKNMLTQKDKQIDISYTTDSSGRTPLHYLCRYKGSDLEDLLTSLLQLKKINEEKVGILEKQCSRGYTALLMLCDEPNPRALKYLLDIGANAINPRTRFTHASPMLVACYQLRGAAARNAPASRLYSVTVTTLAFHIDYMGGPLCHGPDLREETVTTVAISSSAVFLAIRKGLMKAKDFRTKIQERIKEFFPIGYEVLYDIIFSYLVFDTANETLVSDIESQRKPTRKTLRKSSSLPLERLKKSSVILPKPITKSLVRSHRGTSSQSLSSPRIARRASSASSPSSSSSSSSSPSSISSSAVSSSPSSSSPFSHC